MSSALDHRGYVLAELESSEREYVERLKVAAEDYLGYIQSEDDVPTELKADTLAIFCNLPDIYTFHKLTFLPALEACNQDVNAVMQCFNDNKSRFIVYMQYCKNKPTSDSARAEHEMFFRQRQSNLGHKLNIEDLLIAPVQRFTKYQLLLKDLLKDTRKANEDTSSIEETLELMKQIPKETNNIICVSLLRGIHRSRLVGHGSLWVQDTLMFWSDKGHGGVKGEPRQVFLFDHRILIAFPANTDGFFDYVLDIKTLQGLVKTDIKGEPFRFGFITASKEEFYFQAASSSSKAEWVSALNSIISSQSQIMKALVIGKPPTPKSSPHQQSASLDWNDSDSSVDSVHSCGSSSSGEPDWPSQTGFEALQKKKRSTTGPPPLSTSMNTSRNSLTLPSLAHSASFSTSREFSRPRSSLWSATLSPRLMARWRRRRSSERLKPSSVAMPTLPAQHRAGLRSPGSVPRTTRSLLSLNTLFIGKDSLSAAEPISAGQLVAPLDTSQGNQWPVQLLSGPQAGQEMLVPRQSVEEYTAPVSLLPIAQTYDLRKQVGRGRFSKVRKAKHRTTEQYQALKFLRPEVPDEAFHHELCISYRLTHVNIVRCFGGAISDHKRAITFELLKGKVLLDHLLHKSSPTDAEVAVLLGQVLDALHYLHTRTICHLDCRPENMMVCVSHSKELVKLIDFGAARHFGTSRDNLPLEHAHESPVSYQYVSPEVFLHQPLRPAADIWALGVTTFIIFHGTYPFAGKTDAETISNISRGSYHLPNDGACSQNVRNFIRAMLAQQQSDRPSALEAKSLKWFKEDHSGAGPGPWKVQLSHIKQFLAKQH